MKILILFPRTAVTMKILWIAIIVCAVAVLMLALALPGDLLQDKVNGTGTGMGPLVRSQEDAGERLLPGHELPENGIKTAIFSKTVVPNTSYIVVSLYSGDTADPISVTIITPDRTLGPFFDGSDGSVDGRIDLKVSNPDSMTPGTWKFLVHSRKNIAYGSLENLSWIRTGSDDQKTDE